MTTEFWQTIKKEYEAHSGYFLCLNSKTFECAWETSHHRQKIADEARTFLSQARYARYFEVLPNEKLTCSEGLFVVKREQAVPLSALFKLNLSLTNRAVREAFINHQIQKAPPHEV